jgi:hypothetical protein
MERVGGVVDGSESRMEFEGVVGEASALLVGKEGDPENPEFGSFEKRVRLKCELAGGYWSFTRNGNEVM